MGGAARGGALAATVRPRSLDWKGVVVSAPTFLNLDDDTTEAARQDSRKHTRLRQKKGKQTQ